jgi:DNA-binding transcriptional LysR family regulator
MQRDFDDIMLGSLELFCLAAETGGFSKAATQAGVTPAAVSRAVSRLEERLGVRLFVRTTRQIRLTEAGEQYRAQCLAALTLLKDAEMSLSGQQSQPAGKVRLSMPTAYAHWRVLPLLARFQTLYPQLAVDTHISNRNIDFFEEGFDLAIRGKAPAESNMIARKIEDAELIVVASPHYLASAPALNTPDDLTQHRCIGYELSSNGRPLPWLFHQQGEVSERVMDHHITCSEDYIGGLTLARHGAGLFQIYRFVAQQDLNSGQLVEVLQEFGGTRRPFYLLYPHARFLPLRTRTIIDFLLAALRY